MTKDMAKNGIIGHNANSLSLFLTKGAHIIQNKMFTESGKHLVLF